MILTVESLVGMLLIFIFISGRFNDPPTQRSSTTALKFYTYGISYIFIYMFLYFFISLFLSKYPRWTNLIFNITFSNIVELIDDYGITVPETAYSELKSLLSETSTPLIVSLVMYLILSKEKYLKSFDTRLRKRLWSWAAIPREVKRLSEYLIAADFAVPHEIRNEINEKLKNIIDEKDIVYENSSSVQFQFTKITALVLQIEKWKRDNKKAFFDFCEQYETNLDNIKALYKSSLDKARDLFMILHSFKDKMDDHVVNKIIIQYESNFKGQCDYLLNEICLFISRAVLQCLVRGQSRDNRLRDIGFVKIEGSTRLDYIEITKIFLAIFGVCILGFITLLTFFERFKSGGKDIYYYLMLAMMIATIYGLSVFWVLYPKARKWKISETSRTGERRWDFYILAAVFATLSGVFIHFLFCIAFNFLDISKGLSEFLNTAPWNVMEFLTAGILAYNLDNVSKEKENFIHLRECLLQILGGSLGLWFVIIGLQTLGTDIGLERVIGFVGINLPICFFIGYYVPSWYRRSAVQA